MTRVKSASMRARNTVTVPEAAVGCVGRLFSPFSNFGATVTRLAQRERVDPLSVASSTPTPRDAARRQSTTPGRRDIMRKKVDARVRTLIENGVKLRHRSLFVIVGDGGREQVVNLHHTCSRSLENSSPRKPNWTDYNSQSIPTKIML